MVYNIGVNRKGNDIMKFEKPILPKFELSEEEIAVVKELTHYLEDMVDNANITLSLYNVIDTDDKTYNAICNLAMVLNDYDLDTDVYLGSR